MNRKRGGLADSPFFTSTPSPSEVVYSSQQSSIPTERSNERTPDFPNDRTDEAAEQPNGRTVDRTKASRETVRHSFEFYADQIEAIRRLRAQHELAGESISLSDIVRTAIDQYLQEQR